MAERVLVTTDRNQSVVRCGDVYLAATGLRPMSDESVEEFIAYTTEVDARLGAAKAGLQYSPEQSPNAHQRKRFATAQEVAVPYLRMALLTDSAIVRGSVTAIAWLIRSQTDLRAFKTTQWPKALLWQRDAVHLPEDAEDLLATVVTNVGLPKP